MLTSLRNQLRRSVLSRVESPADPRLNVALVGLIAVSAVMLANGAHQFGSHWTAVANAMLVIAAALHVYRCCVDNFARLLTEYNRESYSEKYAVKRNRLLKLINCGTIHGRCI